MRTVYDPILDCEVPCGYFSGGTALEASDASAAAAPAKKDSFCVEHADLIAKYGEPIAYGPKGALKWNQVVFAAKFAKVTPMLFSPEENRFYVYQSATGLWKLESEASLRIKVFQEMLAFAKAEGVPELPFDVGDRGLRNLASILQGIAEQRNAFDTTHGRIHDGVAFSLLEAKLAGRFGRRILESYDKKWIPRLSRLQKQGVRRRFDCRNQMGVCRSDRPEGWPKSATISHKQGPEKSVGVIRSHSTRP